MSVSVAQVRVLALSGSLRKVSKNTALLQAAVIVAPQGMQVDVFGGLGEMPLFNPDIEDQPPYPPSVQAFQRALVRADALLICCPKYAHGVPGAFKNALDWVVGSGEMVDKPVGLLNVSAQGNSAQSSLKETLTVMSARLIPEACLQIILTGPPEEAAALAGRPDVTAALQQALRALVQNVSV